jgi:ABC-2 type transport system permease protein
MIATLVLKDIKLFFRNRFFAVVTVLSVVAFTAIYFLIPENAGNPTLGMAFYLENRETSFIDDTFDDPDTYTYFNSEAEMLAALEAGEDYFAGLSISEADNQAIINNEPVTLNAYYAPDIPSEVKQVFEDVMLLIVNIGNPEFRGKLERINTEKVTLGNDIKDTPISTRDRLLPMLLIFILSVEVLGLATLIVREIQTGTARALITSPLRLSQFFTSKALMGMILAFSQVFIILAVTGKITTSPLLLITTLLLGCFLIVGVGFLIAAIAKDNMSVMAWGALALMTFGIPGIAISLPGLATGWMQIIPSYYLIDSVYKILNFNAGWADVGNSLIILLALGTVLVLFGSAVLRKRF